LLDSNVYINSHVDCLTLLPVNPFFAEEGTADAREKDMGGLGIVLPYPLN
jgi:hypothetical protein